MSLLHAPRPVGAPHLSTERFTDRSLRNWGLQGRRSSTMLSMRHFWGLLLSSPELPAIKQAPFLVHPTQGTRGDVESKQRKGPQERWVQEI